VNDGVTRLVMMMMIAPKVNFQHRYLVSIPDSKSERTFASALPADPAE
jgi:hypothetical protein